MRIKSQIQLQKTRRKLLRIGFAFLDRVQVLEGLQAAPPLAVFLDGAGEKKVLAGGRGNLQSISSGSVQIPRNITVALLFG